MEITEHTSLESQVAFWVDWYARWDTLKYRQRLPALLALQAG